VYHARVKPRAWTVVPHQPLQKLDENLWAVRGTIPGIKMPLLRTMTIARRKDGRLVFVTAVPLEEPAMKAIEALGEPAFLIVPNGWHRTDAFPFKTRYPQLRVFCPKPMTRRVAEAVEVSGALEDLPSDERVSAFGVAGQRFGEAILTVRDAGGATLVFGDTIVNQTHMPTVGGFFFKLFGVSGGPRVHPLMRRFTKAKRFRAQLEELAQAPGLRRIIPGHGDFVEERAPEILREIAARL
jgi:hypothetical protein